MFATKSSLFWGSCGAISGAYFYNKHMYEKELFDRMNYLLQNNVQLSGIYLQQRPPFGFLWYVQWLLPYHQSIMIKQPDGSIRHVGLALIGKGIFNRESAFVIHKGGPYETLNKLDSSIPIEAWVDYKEKYGHYPENLDSSVLKQYTLTHEEAVEPEADPYDRDNVFTTQCGKFYWDETDGSPRFVSCRSAVMDAVRKTELHGLRNAE